MPNNTGPLQVLEICFFRYVALQVKLWNNYRVSYLSCALEACRSFLLSLLFAPIKGSSVTARTGVRMKMRAFGCSKAYTYSCEFSESLWKMCIMKKLQQKKIYTWMSKPFCTKLNLSFFQRQRKRIFNFIFTFWIASYV